MQNETRRTVPSAGDAEDFSGRQLEKQFTTELIIGRTWFEKSLTDVEPKQISKLPQTAN